MKKEDKLAALLFGLCIDETENLIETFKENIVPHNRKKTEFEIILLMSSIILEFTKQHIPLFDSFKKSYSSIILSLCLTSDCSKYPASFLNTIDLSVFSQVKSGSLLPKCP